MGSTICARRLPRPTPKTVEMHLGNAYRKLEIGSRRELTTILPADPIPLTR